MKLKLLLFKKKKNIFMVILYPSYDIILFSLLNLSLIKGQLTLFHPLLVNSSIGITDTQSIIFFVSL